MGRILRGLSGSTDYITTRCGQEIARRFRMLIVTAFGTALAEPPELVESSVIFISVGLESLDSRRLPEFVYFCLEFDCVSILKYVSLSTHVPNHHRALRKTRKIHNNRCENNVLLNF